MIMVAKGSRCAQWRQAAVAVLVVALALVVAAGVAARVVGLPQYVAESGDEWGNMVASLRVLHERGDPGAFIHPALYYDVTAAVFLLVFAVARVFHLCGDAPTIADVFLCAPRSFVLAARAVSLFGAVWALAALYGFARWLWSRPAGWAAAALLAVLPLHVLYSKTIRVDALFVAVFVSATWCVVWLLDDRSRRAAGRAAAAVGLAAAANYNGGILIVWLIAALWARPTGEGNVARRVAAALALAGVVFLAVNPFVLLDASTFATDALYQAGLAITAHPGWEGRGPFFYAADLLRASVPLAVLVVVSVLCFAAFGTRRERFLVSVPVVYFVLVSALRTREDRFMLPALALFALVAAGLPALLGRRLAAWPRSAAAAALLCYAGLAAAVASMAPAALTVPQPRPHQNLPRVESGVLDWIEANASPGSRILVESGIVPLIDTLNEPSRFAAALRRSLLARRPKLDQHFLGAIFLGGCNYDPGWVTRGEIDYAVIAPRNVQYIEKHCAELAPVCAFYAALRSRADVVATAPPGFEPVEIYALRR